MSVRLAVLARDGRGGGGEVVVMGGLSLRLLEREGAAKGSRSTGCVVCLRGGGFWSELRTLGGVPDEFLASGGGGGACLEGTNESEPG